MNRRDKAAFFWILIFVVIWLISVLLKYNFISYVSLLLAVLSVFTWYQGRDNFQGTYDLNLFAGSFRCNCKTHEDIYFLDTNNYEERKSNILSKKFHLQLSGSNSENHVIYCFNCSELHDVKRNITITGPEFISNNSMNVSTWNAEEWENMGLKDVWNIIQFRNKNKTQNPWG